MKKALRLLKLNCEAKTAPADIARYAIDNDMDATIVKVMDDTPENRELALRWLENRRQYNSCRKLATYAGSVYVIEAYAVEYYTADDDGELIEGSDFDV